VVLEVAPEAMLGRANRCPGGGARQRSLASRLRFCAVAVSRTSSLTPLKPRSRKRSSLRMRFAPGAVQRARQAELAGSLWPMSRQSRRHKRRCYSSLNGRPRIV